MIGKSGLVNTNKLVRTYKGCTGLKTGSTSTALYNLSASATRDNFSLIAVVMKAPTSKIRFQNASTLLDYGFTNFEYKSLVNENDIIQSIKINKGIPPTINAISKESLGYIAQKGTDVNIEQNITINSNLEAPIKEGDIVGKISFTLNGENIAETDLLSYEDVKKINLFSMNKIVLNKWINLFR